MNRIKINGLNLWQFELLKKEPGVTHFVTDRRAENTQEFTLSFSGSPDKAVIKAHRDLMAAALGVPEDRFYIPSQVHKNKIVKVNQSTKQEDLKETDALITQETGIAIAVLVADCVPILLYDKRNKVIGAIHSGWRGTVAKILEKTLLEMHQAFGTRGKDIIACIGPSICQESYEVGEEVINQVTQAFGAQNDLFFPQSDHKAKLDLWKATHLQLLEFGVEAASIEIANLCTVKNNLNFFSARKGDTGRMAAGIVLNL